MSAPRYKTLGDIASDIAGSLGYISNGSVTSEKQKMFFLNVQTAQRTIAMGTPELIRRIRHKSNCVAGMSFYDIPDDCDPLEIDCISVKWGETFVPLQDGFKRRRSIDPDGTGYPCFYELRRGTTDQAQIELFPTPNAAYPLEWEYQMRVNSLVNHTDRPIVDDHAVFLLALSNAFTHHRMRDDAQATAAQYQQYLGQLKFKQHGNRQYIVDGDDYESSNIVYGDSHASAPQANSTSNTPPPILPSGVNEW